MPSQSAEDKSRILGGPPSEGCPDTIQAIGSFSAAKVLAVNFTYYVISSFLSLLNYLTDQIPRKLLRATNVSGNSACTCTKRCNITLLEKEMIEELEQKFGTCGPQTIRCVISSRDTFLTYQTDRNLCGNKRDARAVGNTTNRSDTSPFSGFGQNIQLLITFG
jgi:hypothetical protein